MQREIIYVGEAENFKNRGVADHPQWKHMDYPPEGYIFNRGPENGVYVSERNLINLKKCCGVSLTEDEKEIENELIRRRQEINHRWDEIEKYCINNSISLDVLERYKRVTDINHRGEQLPLDTTKIAFLPSYPYSVQNMPYIIEIEDIYTLLWPFIINGGNKDADVLNSDIFKLIKYLLSRKECLFILCHVSSTCASLKRHMPEIEDKFRFIPLGVPSVSETNLCNTYKKKLGEKIRLLFTSSWNSPNFGVRGGFDCLYAFDKLCERYDNLELIIKGKYPEKSDMPEECREIIKRRQDRIHQIDVRLSDEEMGVLLKNVDVFLLASARVHIVSLLKPMTYGIPVVVSDGWGFEDYVVDRENAIEIKGRYGKTSWVDEDGIMREDYDFISSRIDYDVANNMVAGIDELISDDSLRYYITENAMNMVNNSMNIWNKGLKELFDEAYHEIEFGV